MLEEYKELILWHLSNSLDRCVEEGMSPPDDSQGLLHALSQQSDAEQIREWAEAYPQMSLWANP